MRPRSIARYEKLYVLQTLLAFAETLWARADLLSGPRSLDTMVGNPHSIQSLISRHGIVVYVAEFFVGFGLSLVLWYFTARRPSKIARGVFVLALLGTVISIVQQALTHTLSGTPVACVGYVNDALIAICVSLLFRHDSNDWFARKWSDPNVRQVFE